MERQKTDIPFDFVTVKTTKSRIQKGLLSIPVSLIDLFPKLSSTIYLIDELGNESAKAFTAYTSSSRECRIGGLRYFYDYYNIEDGNEIVVQFLDNGKFRIIPENYFKSKLLKNLSEFEQINNEDMLEQKLNEIAQIANISKQEIFKNQFVRLSHTTIKNRGMETKDSIKIKSSVSLSLRKILLALYEGKCQITNFTFEMKNHIPYFEIHHIHPEKGEHVKNLLVVSANTHAQFTYANLEQEFDQHGWLRTVSFNGKEHRVYQVIDKLPHFFEKEIHT